MKRQWVKEQSIMPPPIANIIIGYVGLAEKLIWQKEIGFLSYPALDFCPCGNIYLSDRKGFIHVYDKVGTEIHKWLADADYLFISNEEVYLSTTHSLISVHDLRGKLLRSWKMMANASLAISSTEKSIIYINSGFSSQLNVYTTEGKFLYSPGFYFSEGKSLENVSDIFIWRNKLFVTQSTYVFIFDLNGNLLNKWNGSRHGQVLRSIKIIDTEVYVTEVRYNIHVFTLEGEYLRSVSEKVIGNWDFALSTNTLCVYDDVARRLLYYERDLA